MRIRCSQTAWTCLLAITLSALGCTGSGEVSHDAATSPSSQAGRITADAGEARSPDAGGPTDPAHLGARLEALPKDLSLFLISVDSLRWNEPGFMGYEKDVTPNLDRLAASGLVYDRAYGLGSYTGQAIPPLLTGKYASELMRNDEHETKLSARERPLGEFVCRRGVLCKGIVSHYLFNQRNGWAQGFQEWIIAPGAPPGPGIRDEKYSAHTVAGEAIRWMRKPENTAGRFLLWTHFMDPHKDYLTHPGFGRFGDDHRGRYDQEVAFTDHHIGRMLERFAKLPAAKRTVIVLTADHGEAFGEHGRKFHGRELWEEIIRVPLVVVGPGIAPRRIARPTSHIDLFPTLLALFGEEIPEGVHGKSLLDEWRGGPLVEERPVLADQPENPYYEMRRVFIEDGWKLHVLRDGQEHRLFRIGEDYERGDSLVEDEPERFERIKGSYERFVKDEMKVLSPVGYPGGHYRDMPDGPGWP